MKRWKKIRTGAFAIVLSTAFLVSSAGLLPAGPSIVYADEQEDIAEIKKKNAEREKKKSAAQEKLNSLNIESDNIKDIIEQLDQQIGEYQIKIMQITEERNSIQAEIAVTESNLQIAYIAEANQYARMKERIAYAYENGDIEYLDALVSLDDFSDVINQSEYVEQISSYDQNQLNKLMEIKKSISKDEEVLKEKLSKVLDLKEEAESEQEALQITQAGKKEKLEEYSYMIYDARTEVNDYQKLIEEGDYEIQLLEKEYKRKQEEAKRKKEEEERKKKEEEKKRAEEQKRQNEAAMHSSGGNTSGTYDEVTPTYSSTGWRWPCPSSHHITSYFGSRTPPVAGATSYHQAIDIGVGTGNKVVAAAAGRIMYTAYSSARGNYIRVDHGGGLTTLYQHLSGFAGYNSGDYVEAGTVIAYSGMTGICSGPHLHFEVWKNGVPVNPLNYVN